MELLPETASDDLQVIGIAVFPKGLEALEALFRAMPADSGMAFLIMPWNSDISFPIPPSRLRRLTSMPTIAVDQQLPLHPNHIYFPAAGCRLVFDRQHTVNCEGSRPATTRKMLNDFFHSLAVHHHRQAACLLLPADPEIDVEGVRSIRQHGGLVFSQATGSDKPAASNEALLAMSNGILPAEDIAKQLLMHMRLPSTASEKPRTSLAYQWVEAIDSVIKLLHVETNHDFTQYKHNTIYRRIERRMELLRLSDPLDYLEALKASKHEISILFNDLLIGVTSFFRDPEAFSALGEKFLPALLLKKKQGQPFRAWIPGCSSGEEAYTVAIILIECMERLGVHVDTQIFATDLDEKAIRKARLGRYPESIAQTLSSERLARFFRKTGDTYQVEKSLREKVIFAQQNLIKDPPFTKLDLLCCRNLLIYFSTALQKKLIPLFHYTLNPCGILCIGTFETIGSFQDLFEPLDLKYKIFSRVTTETSPHPLLHFPPRWQNTAMDTTVDTTGASPQRPPSSAKILKTILGKSDISSCLVIDERGDIVYIHGHTGRYLEPAEGKATMNLLKMARPGIRAALSKAYRLALEENIESRAEGLYASEDFGSGLVDLVVTPLTDSELGRGMMLVIFNAIESHDGQAASAGKRSMAKTGSQSTEIRRLREQLSSTQRSLQSTIEELESSNEELLSANEELQSTNEELQSTNEELETSREELQSSNEESAAVNTELQKRIDEMVAANEDLQHMLDATNIAAVFLDARLRIRRFTSKAGEIFPFTDGDVGRPITDFSTKLQNVALEQYASSVLKDLERKTVEVMDNAGRVYRMRLRPFRKSASTIDGLVITFEDISETITLVETDRRLETILRDTGEAVTLQDLDGNILSWNRGAERLYGYSEAEAIQMNIRELIPPDDNDKLAQLYQRLTKEDVRLLEVRRRHKDGHALDIVLTVSRIADNSGRVRYLSTIEKELPAAARTKPTRM